MRQRPMAAPAVDPAVAQQERQQLLALAAEIVGRRFPGAHKIAHCFMRRVRRPHSRQLAGTMQPRQRHRVAPVGLDPLARPLRDQRRSDHQASVAESPDLAIKPISRRPGLKADMQPVVSLRQSLDRPLDWSRAVLDLAEKPNLASPACFRDRHGVLLLGDVESDKNFAMLSHGPPSVHEARLGLPSKPRSYLHERAGHRLSPRT